MQWEETGRKEVEEELKADRPTVLVCMCPVSWIAGAVVGGDVKHTILEIVKQFSAKYMKPEIIPRTVSDSQVLELPVFVTHTSCRRSVTPCMLLATQNKQIFLVGFANASEVQYVLNRYTENPHPAVKLTSHQAFAKYPIDVAFGGSTRQAAFDRGGGRVKRVVRDTNVRRHFVLRPHPPVPVTT